MKTEIYESYIAFLAREDKAINGVSQSFADTNPGWAIEKNNEGCWNCSGCSDCYHCSNCSNCSRCYDCSGCYDCSDCSDCSRCSGCYDCCNCCSCSNCSNCSRCYNCSDCSDRSDRSDSMHNSQSPQLLLPTIPNIHQCVAEAVSQPNALDMDDWHTCETTHCRAGWVVTLAGADGKALESKTSTEFAAMLIYKASSKIRVSPARFYETNEEAMADILRCAKEEAAE